MIFTVKNEVPFQILSSSFSIGPSPTGYELQVGADSKTFSTLFSVGANTPRMVTNVANGSYFRLKNNVGDVKVNWQRVCVTEGGEGGSGTELQPVADFPLNAVEGTVISYTGSSSASGVYQYDGNEWTEVGAIDLSPYWTSAETQSAITAVEDHLFDVEQVTASALTELHDGLLEVSARTVDMSAYWDSAETQDAIDDKLLAYWTSAETQDAIDEAISGFTPATNSPIIPAISSQTEYEAISGDVKTGDLIQVYNVDINGDGDPEYGLFQAEVQEEEDGPGGDIIRIVYWERKDNADSVLWADKIYPWMADNDVWPVDFGEGHFLISTDDTSEDEAYNGIGFDNDGKPVITHITPEYDDQTGEITGITREDRDILGELDEVVADVNEAFSAISETQRVAAAGLNRLEERIDELSAATPSVDLSGYYTSAQTDAAISAATSGKADAASVSANTSNRYFPSWNEQGIITGKADDTPVLPGYLGINGTGFTIYSRRSNLGSIYGPQSAGTAGDILVSTGRGAPVWSAVTFPDVSNYVTSAQVETQIVEKNYINSGDVKSQVEAYNYATVSQIPTVPTSNTAFTNDAGYITSAAIANMVTSTSVSTIWRGTQSDYDAIVDKDPNTFYIIVNN